MIKIKVNEIQYQIYHGGQLVSILRKLNQLTQKQLAEVVGTNQSNIANIEKNRRVIGKKLAGKLGLLFNTYYQNFL